MTDSILDIQQNCVSLDKMSSAKLTKYEKTNVLGLRIEQLNFGSKTLLDETELQNCNSIHQIAEREFELNLLPFIIQRQICDKKTEYFKLKDMSDHH